MTPRLSTPHGALRIARLRCRPVPGWARAIVIGLLPMTPLSQRARGVAMVLLNNALLGFAMGMYLPFVPLRLHELGVSAGMIGLNAAASSVAVLGIAAVTTRILRRTGYPAAIGIGATLFVVALLGMMRWQGFGPWTACRFVAGLGLALHWISSESWINQAANDARRGRILSLYVACFIGGTAAGSAALDFIDMSGQRPFMIMIALSAAATALIPLGRKGAPPTGSMPAAGLLVRVRQVPRLMASALMMGVAQGSALMLMAFYGVSAGLTQGAAVWLNAAYLLGGVLLQAPIGWAVDRFDRRRLLAGMALAAAACGLLLHLFIQTTLPMYTLAFLGGGISLGLYTAGLALLGSRFQSGGMAAANAAFILIWEMGTLSGGPLSGGAIALMGAVGFPLVTTGAMIGVMLITVWPHGKDDCETLANRVRDQNVTQTP